MTRAQIEDDIAAARGRLADNIAELINQVHPRAVVHNTVADARQLVAGEFRQVKEQLVDADGVRVERVALLGAAAAGTVAFVMVIRSIFRR
jgi:phosphatidylserine decarboxylase